MCQIKRTLSISIKKYENSLNCDVSFRRKSPIFEHFIALKKSKLIKSASFSADCAKRLVKGVLL